jgi:hypothetical protein
MRQMCEYYVKIHYTNQKQDKCTTSTSGTSGTFGTLFAPKTPEKTLKRRFLDCFLHVFRPKNTHFSPKNSKKTSIFAHFLMFFDEKLKVFIAFAWVIGTN